MWNLSSPTRIFFCLIFVYLAEPSLGCSIGISCCDMWTLSCGMWGLVPSPGVEPRPPARAQWSISHWAARETPVVLITAVLERVKVWL